MACWHGTGTVQDRGRWLLLLLTANHILGSSIAHTTGCAGVGRRCGGAGAWKGGCTKPVKLTNLAGLPQLSPDGVRSEADLYYCPGSASKPLLVVLPGAVGDKAWYSQLATTLAASGRGAVIVGQQLRCFPTACDKQTAPPFCFCGNFASRFFVDEAAAWAKSKKKRAPGLKLDGDRLYVIGHSFGAAEALYVMAARCGQACIKPDSYQAKPAVVKAAFGWGYALPLSTGTNSTAPQNTEGPFAWINGGGDNLARPERQDGTLAQLLPPKAYATLSKLDHFSIADRYWPALPRPFDVNSTLSREEQTSAVAKGVMGWLDAASKLQSCKKAAGSLCGRLQGTDFGVPTVTVCKEERCG